MNSIKINPFEIFKIIGIFCGVVLALIDPIKFSPQFIGIYHHLFRRFCWIVLGLGLSQFIAHLGMARVYFYEIYQPGVSNKIKEQLHQTKDKLGSWQLFCAFVMCTSMLLPLVVAVDWIPLRWWFSPLSFKGFVENKSILLIVHFVAAAIVPVSGMVCNSITRVGNDRVNMYED
jgi:hypothetical protein